MAANRERRVGAGKRSYEVAALDALKAVREGKGSRASQVVLKDSGDVYEEMDDATYAAFVQSRKRDDAGFVEDDGAGDYMDDGEEHWDDSEEGQRKRAISKVAMPLRRGGQKGPLMGVDNHVASVFLGGRAVRPGQVNADTLMHCTRIHCTMHNARATLSIVEHAWKLCSPLSLLSCRLFFALCAVLRLRRRSSERGR